MDTPNDAIDRLAKKDGIPEISEEGDMRLVRASLGIRASGSKLQDSSVDNQRVDVFRVSEFGQRAASSRRVAIIYDMRPAFGF